MINQPWKENKLKPHSWQLLIEHGNKFYQTKQAGLVIRIYVLGKSEFALAYSVNTLPESRIGLVYRSFEVAKDRARDLMATLLKKNMA